MILANKFFEVQKFLTLTNHQYNPQSLIFSKKVWDTLSPAEQKIVTTPRPKPRSTSARSTATPRPTSSTR